MTIPKFLTADHELLMMEELYINNIIIMYINNVVNNVVLKALECLRLKQRPCHHNFSKHLLRDFVCCEHHSGYYALSITVCVFCDRTVFGATEVIVVVYLTDEYTRVCVRKVLCLHIPKTDM